MYLFTFNCMSVYCIILSAFDSIDVPFRFHLTMSSGSILYIWYIWYVMYAQICYIIHYRKWIQYNARLYIIIIIIIILIMFTEYC